MENNEEYRMPLIGDAAPAFHAVTTQGEINFPKDYAGKWVILFSHPSDFTPVCTTEYMTLASMIKDFKEINTELIGISIDSLFSHIAWLKKIQELVWKGIKRQEVTFPLIEDIKMDIAKKYGMVHPNVSEVQTVRSVFIIDSLGMVRAILHYPFSTGRNMDELMRIIISMQKYDEEDVATPANWMPGDDVILRPAETCKAAKDRFNGCKENMYCIDWFLYFKQS